MHLRDIQREAWRIAEAKGHHDTLRAIPIREATLIRLALAHTEVSEATQEVKRYGVTPASAATLAHEVVDTIIRLVELVEDINVRCDADINLDEVMVHVMATNECRPYMYGTPWE